MRISSRAPHTAHYITGIAVGTDAMSFHLTFALINIPPHIHNKNFHILCEFMRGEHSSRPSAYNNYIIFFVYSYEITSERISISRAIFISRAIRLPIERFSSTRSEYGDPEMNRFVPATMRADISKTFNSSESVTTVSRQNGPIIPPNNSIDFSTTFSPISKILGRRDSRIIRGKFPVTTKVG